MGSEFQPRFFNGIYRDCKWCQGAGCLSCQAEADKEYNRQFPDGPKPIATIPLDEPLDLNKKDDLKRLCDLVNEALSDNEEKESETTNNDN